MFEWLYIFIATTAATTECFIDWNWRNRALDKAGVGFTDGKRGVVLLDFDEFGLGLV